PPAALRRRPAPVRVPAGDRVRPRRNRRPLGEQGYAVSDPRRRPALDALSAGGATRGRRRPLGGRRGRTRVRAPRPHLAQARAVPPRGDRDSPRAPAHRPHLAVCDRLSAPPPTSRHTRSSHPPFEAPAGSARRRYSGCPTSPPPGARTKGRRLRPFVMAGTVTCGRDESPQVLC